MLTNRLAPATSAAGTARRMAALRAFFRPATAFIAMAFLALPAHAKSWPRRDDAGVAAVDTRTGKVLWEAWRGDEVPAGASQEEKTGVDYLLALALVRSSGTPLPPVTPLPDVPIREVDIKNPWPETRAGRGGAASEGKHLIYYRQPQGVIALDRKTRNEVWRLETKRFPDPSHVVEAGAHQALIQIGSLIPMTIQTVLSAGPGRSPGMAGLEPHTLKQRAAAAMLLGHYGDGYLRPEVKRLAEELRAEKSDPAALTAATTIGKLLADWPKTRDRQRLVEGCVAALLGAGEGNPLKDYAWPGAHRILTWCLFQELLYGSPRDAYSRQGYNYSYDEGNERPLRLDDTTRMKLLDLCRKVAFEGPDAEKPYAASVLVSSSLGWSSMTDAERKQLFFSSDASAWRWTALALSRNGRRKELMEWARERPADDHLDAVWLLARDRKGWPEEELKFWVACARHAPGFIANVLRNDKEQPPPAEFHEPIRAYLQREIGKPTVVDAGTQPAYNLSAAVTVLDRWKREDDTPLLLEYLKHPASSKGTHSSGAVVRQYALRALVRDLLEKRGITIPPNVVYKEPAPAKE